jgi:methylase of polypeptide subunit release factors
MSASTPNAPFPSLAWQESGHLHSAAWRSASGSALPKKVVIADDTLNADAAYPLVCEGTALLWRGDFHQGRQMVQALARRLDKAHAKKLAKQPPPAQPPSPREIFYAHRQAQAQRARVLGLVVVELAAHYTLALRRAPNMQEACTQAWGTPQEVGCIVSLRELMGVVAASEWRKKGVEIAALAGVGDGRIYPHYGVFSPVRGEYVDLVAQAIALRKKSKPVVPIATAFDIGAGTGVLSAVLASRGVGQVVGTDQHPRAIACAQHNIKRLGLASRVQMVQTDLFPDGLADIVVCNPPWLPGRPSSALEHAVYDPDSSMLRGFLNGLRGHLAPQGEGWLVMSDLAEHLGLRAQDDLQNLILAAGLAVLGRLDTKPTHAKAQDTTDPLHTARSREVTTLWRLGAAGT